MKNKFYFSCLFFLLLTFSTQAQLLERTFHPGFFSQAEKTIPFGEDKWIVGGRAGSEIGFIGLTPFIYVMDDSGEILWTYNFYPMKAEDGFIVAMFPTSVSTFSVLVYGGLCDVGGSIVIYDFDINGEVLNGGSVWESYGIDFATNATQFENGDYLLYRYYDRTLQKITSSGDEIWDIDYNESYSSGDFAEVAIHPNQNVLVAGDRGLMEVNADGEVLQTAYRDTTFQAVQNSIFHQYIALGDNELFDLDSQLNVIQGLDLTAWGNFDAIKAGTSNYFLRGSRNDSTVVLQLNAQLEYLHHFQYQTPDSEIVDFGIRDNIILLVGQKNHPYNGGNSAMLAKSFLPDGTTLELETDAGVVGINTDRPTSQDLNWQGCEIDLSLSYPTVMVSVQNFGNTVIESLNINARYPTCSFICYSLQPFFASFEGFQLLPGETMDFNMGVMNVLVNANIEVHDLCFWVSVPNNEIDRNPTNDNHCIEFIISDVENLLSENNIQIFPNPASKDFQIVFPAPLQERTQLSIYDSSGKIVQIAQLEKNKTQTTIDVKHLPKGLYWIKINDQIIEKIVVY